MRDHGSSRLRVEIGIGEKPHGSAEGGGFQGVIGRLSHKLPINSQKVANKSA